MWRHGCCPLLVSSDSRLIHPKEGLSLPSDENREFRIENWSGSKRSRDEERDAYFEIDRNGGRLLSQCVAALQAIEAAAARRY